MSVRNSHYLWAGALGLSLAIGISAPAQAFFSEIALRPARDGAGPTHIFRLQGDALAVLDPLDGEVYAFMPGAGRPTRTAKLPAGARPWRLVRRPDRIDVIAEDQNTRIEIPRDVEKWPGEFPAISHTRDDPRFKMPAAKRNAQDRITLLRSRGQRALTIRAVGPHYLASVRELEPGADGRRHVLWKESYFFEPEKSDPRARKIQVEIYVGRFEKNGTLSGLVRLPLERMTRLGFDYATILPDGTVGLLASLDRKPFAITSLSFAVPAPARSTARRASSRRWALPPPVGEPRPHITPEDTNVVDPGDEPVPLQSPETVEGAVEKLTRADFRKTMDAYRQHEWRLHESNLRHPCKAAIMPEGPITCAKPDVFVLPARQARKPPPASLKGVAYNWGGADTIAKFDEKLTRGYVAGNIGSTFWADGTPQVTAGVDCSGFVSNVWKLGQHVSSAALDDVSVPLSQLSQLKVGDALLFAGVHVVLYREQLLLDGASLSIRVTEAASRCGSVCDSVYEIERFHNYTLRRLKNLQAARP